VLKGPLLRIVKLTIAKRWLNELSSQLCIMAEGSETRYICIRQN